VAGRYMTTTEIVGRAMLALARGADPGTRILTSREMNSLA
jgi:hypothetical protein